MDVITDRGARLIRRERHFRRITRGRVPLNVGKIRSRLISYKFNLQYANHVFQHVGGGHFFFVWQTIRAALGGVIGIVSPRPIETRQLFYSGEAIRTGHAENREGPAAATRSWEHGAFKDP